MKNERPLAHIKQLPTGEWQEHALEEHLRAVGGLAAEYAESINGREWARLAGLWHDLGKYSAAFQGYIKTASGFERAEAHIEGMAGRVDHSTAGAIYAVDKFKAAGRVLAYLIAGHHAGLPDWAGDANAAASLSYRLGKRQHLESLPIDAIPSDICDPEGNPGGKIPGGPQGAHLWLRILFSCLVDADFLDTEAFMSPDKAIGRGDYLNIKTLLFRFDAYMARFERTAATAVNRVRADVLRQCREKAVLPPGIFSLTVPTGGGKTLSSLAFALEHANRHGKRRVIYAIPFTSIVEQTCDVYRDVFGETVIEHHSNLDPDKETAKSRLATENWDAPVVVTTNVQLFESLFAAKPSRCRKLHNFVDSVIVVDEAQTLPPELLQPCLDALNLLSRHYGVTVVLCTATQPALRDVKSFGRELRGLDEATEIIDDPQALFDALKRVTVELPADFQARYTWDGVGTEIRGHEAVLAIVNTRRDCRELWERMPKATVHLSASMCGAHRAQRIDEVRSRLKNAEPVRVVSTQLIEAGVDVDFPVVYRALAGIDSIAQAAGRCNREGTRATGRVVVFVPPKAAPPGQLRRAEQATVGMMAGTNLDPLAPEVFRSYFERFYLSEDNWDKYDMHGLLVRDVDSKRMDIQFRTAAQAFRYVDDADSQPILVWWDDSPVLIGRLEKSGPERWLMRKLQRYMVNLPCRTAAKLLETHEVREVWPGIFAQAVDTLYHPDLGVVVQTRLDVEQLVI